MDDYLDEKKRQRRSKKLIEGKCDHCHEEAQVPWKTEKFCYNCWIKFWQKEIRKYEKT
jgi:hypothetical protein